MGSKYMGIGIAMGLAVGGTLGLVLDNPLAWLGLGAAAGLAGASVRLLPKRPDLKPDVVARGILIFASSILTG